MNFTGIVKDIIDLAKENKRKIAFPESEDIRILKATEYILNYKIANIVLIGNKNNINKICKNNNINIDGVEIIEKETYHKKEEYILNLYELRKHKKITLEDARNMLDDNMYFATMMLKNGDVDGVVSGAIHSTADTLRPALQIIKTNENCKCVSSFFLMQTKNTLLGENGIFIFSDCGLIEFPTEEELVEIALQSANTFKTIVKREPKVALLSYSTKGSKKSEASQKIANVLNKIKSMEIDFDIDGELQLDAAIIPEVASIKVENSSVAGHANVLIFPDIQAGNIGYKIAQRFGNMLALGPITQGLNKPVNDLSRGCNVEDIIGTVALTCLQVK